MRKKGEGFQGDEEVEMMWARMGAGVAGTCLLMFCIFALNGNHA